MDIGSILGTIFSGGVTGILGSVVSAISSYKVKKLEYEHKEKMMNLQLERDKLLGQLKQKQNEQEIKKVEIIEESELQKESYKHDEATYVKYIHFEKLGFLGKILGGIVGLFLGVVDFLRGLIRPGSTIYFEIFMFYIWISVYNLVKGLDSIPKEKLIDLFFSLTLVIIYCATTCVLWWFGSRHIDKAIKILGVKDEKKMPQMSQRIRQ